MEEEAKKEVKQEQIHDLLFNKEIGWQEIIYDLINTEQLDPWDINITSLADKYMEKIQELEENYFVSSKVLLAAALLLRIKSEILLNKYIKSIDDILFARKEDVSKKEIERIELDEEIPELVVKSPLPRFRKVTLKELIESLDKAIVTENRRIKRKIIDNNALREAGIALPKKTFALKDKINEIYDLILQHLETDERVHFSKLSKEEKEDKIATFLSILHLENQNKIWIHQEEAFGDIHIWHKKVYFKKFDPFWDLMGE
ncbi:MAG: segregation/condensation protein A [Candidatus Pacearchaeota archaeon]